MPAARGVVVIMVAALLAAACSSADQDDLGTINSAPAEAQRQAADVDAVGGPEAVPPQAPGEAPGEVTFADHGLAGFVNTADLAVSTFQTDADAASFRLAQAWLQRRGVVPPGEAVRAEEWVNALDQRYPDPETGETFRLLADAGSPWWHAPPGAPQETVLLRVGVQAAREVARPPASITLVIDTSGSMADEDRLRTVVDVAGTLLDRLEDRDQIGVVEFSNDASVVIEHTSDFDAVRDALQGLRPRQSTNTGAGVLLGHEQAAAAHREGDNSTVVVFADGVANQGITDPDEILAQLGDGARRFVTHTVGVGLEVYNDALLERLANASGGTYAYVELAEHAQQLFERDLPVLAPVARDVKAQVAFDPAAVGAWRLIGYENRLITAEEFRDDAVPGGYVGAGHAVTALYELVVDRESDAGAERLGTVTLRWADPASGEVTETAAHLPAELLGTEATSSTFATAAAMGAFAEALRASPHAIVDLGQVADRLEATGEDQDAWLAGIVRGAAAAAQVASPDRREIHPPDVRIQDQTP